MNSKLPLFLFGRKTPECSKMLRHRLRAPKQVFAVTLNRPEVVSQYKLQPGLLRSRSVRRDTETRHRPDRFPCYGWNTIPSIATVKTAAVEIPRDEEKQPRGTLPLSCFWEALLFHRTIGDSALLDCNTYSLAINPSSDSRPPE